MNLNRARTFIIATAAALLLVPGVASAAILKGDTRQPGKTITLKTAADGSVKSGTIDWKTKCTNGARPNGSTTFRSLKRSTPQGFSSGGKDVDKKGKYTYTFRSRIEGEARGLGFKGIFKSSVKIEKRGDLITRCKTGKIRWAAQ